MSTEDISQAIQRVRGLLARRPKAGMHIDEPAVARWEKDVRIVTQHENGTQVVSDLPAELGGSGTQVTPGWFLRAGLASCLATRIAMEAATAGIAITRLEVVAVSNSDARGLLGVPDETGAKVPPAPRGVRLEVSLSAPGIARERLQALVEESVRCSPVSAALANVVPVELRLESDSP
jgi:uncharacterized OsmC-like protein